MCLYTNQIRWECMLHWLGSEAKVKTIYSTILHQFYMLSFSFSIVMLTDWCLCKYNIKRKQTTTYNNNIQQHATTGTTIAAATKTTDNYPASWSSSVKKDTNMSLPPCKCRTKISSNFSLVAVKGPAVSLSTNTVISTVLQSSKSTRQGEYI